MFGHLNIKDDIMSNNPRLKVFWKKSPNVTATPSLHSKNLLLCIWWRRICEMVHIEVLKLAQVVNAEKTLL